MNRTFIAYEGLSMFVTWVIVVMSITAGVLLPIAVGLKVFDNHGLEGLVVGILAWPTAFVAFINLAVFVSNRWPDLYANLTYLAFVVALLLTGSIATVLVGGIFKLSKYLVKYGSE